MDTQSRWWAVIIFLLFWILMNWLLTGCAHIEGPCKVDESGIVCKETGRARVLGPANTVDAVHEGDKEKDCECPRRRGRGP